MTRLSGQRLSVQRQIDYVMTFEIESKSLDIISLSWTLSVKNESISNVCLCVCLSVLLRHMATKFIKVSEGQYFSVCLSKKPQYFLTGFHTFLCKEVFLF